jgi:hypothetical protein
MPTNESEHRAHWRVGQRVVRKDSDENGTVLEVDRGTVKVKWDGGRTSYFRPDTPGNVQLADQEP